MNNNVGMINIELIRQVGQDTPVVLSDNVYINVMSGQLGIGFFVYDKNGTMAICTDISTINEQLTYTFKTVTLNTEIDITALLTRGY